MESEEVDILKELLRQLPHQIFWKDIKGVYLGCNDIFAHSLGLKSPENVVGKTDYELPPTKEQSDSFRKDDMEVISTLQPKLNIEEQQTLLNGETITLLTSKVPFFDKQKNLIGILGIYTDISYIKDLEKNLLKSKEKTELLSKSKSEFIANMSHDLRTPITGILGMVQDMMNVTEQAQSSLNQSSAQQNIATLKEIISTVQRDGHLLVGATDELLQLCNEILDVVQLESGKASGVSEAFSLHDVVNHNIELLQPTARHKKLTLSADIDPSIPHYLKGVRTYLDRTLLNLISNALKFTKEGSVEVVIRLQDNKTATVGETVNLQIQVKDTGIGIPEDKFDEIFEHFSRLSPAYEGLYKGAGLGLYTVKRYVNAIGGDIRVDSTVDQGTCFTLRLPFTVSDHTDQVKQSIRPQKVTSTKQQHVVPQVEETLTPEEALASILVVEDNPLAVVAIKLALKPFHCHIETASSGSQAVKMAESNDYNLILMDIGLPDFDGIEATMKIRALPDAKRSQVPIVALTGHANNPEKRQEGLDAGMQDLLSKPAQPLALEAVLQEYAFQKKESAEKTDTKEEKNIPPLPLIDWDACVRMSHDDVDLTKQMLSMLNEELETTKKVLTECYPTEQFHELREELHRCRGGVCYLKLPELEAALKTFHEALKETPQNKQLLGSAYAKLQQAIDRFQIAWQKQDFYS